MSEFHKWPKIQNFNSLVKTLERYGLPEDPITFVPKVKLHGTNAGIRINPNGSIYAQSRKRTITVDSDNAGFAEWVSANNKNLKRLVKDHSFIIFGEWIGKGIQSGVACSQLDLKVFAAFGLYFPEEEDQIAQYVCDEKLIREYVKDFPQIEVIPSRVKDSITIDFRDPNSIAVAAAKINELVDQIEKEDPYIKSLYGISGTGEGAVYYPVRVTEDPFKHELMFKAKGEAHRVKAQKSAALVPTDMVDVSSIQMFVDTYVTENRLNQGLMEVGGIKDPKQTGEFLKWMCKDVFEEGKEDIDKLYSEAGIKWKLISKYVIQKSKDFWLH